MIRLVLLLVLCALEVGQSLRRSFLATFPSSSLCLPHKKLHLACDVTDANTKADSDSVYSRGLSTLIEYLNSAPAEEFLKKLALTDKKLAEEVKSATFHSLLITLLPFHLHLSLLAPRFVSLFSLHVGKLGQHVVRG